jgi:hypothetical protein
VLNAAGSLVVPDPQARLDGQIESRSFSAQAKIAIGVILWERGGIPKSDPLKYIPSDERPHATSPICLDREAELAGIDAFGSDYSLPSGARIIIAAHRKDLIRRVHEIYL